MRRPAEDSDGEEGAFSYMMLRTGRILLWWLIAEYMIHVMYMHSIQTNVTYLEILPPWALGKCCRVLGSFLKNLSSIDFYLISATSNAHWTNEPLKFMQCRIQENIIITGFSWFGN